MQIQLIVTLMIALILVVLHIQNPNPIPIQFMRLGSPQGIPLVVVILVSVLAGVITSALLGLKKQLQLKDKIRELQMETDELRQSPGMADGDPRKEVEPSAPGHRDQATQGGKL